MRISHETIYAYVYGPDGQSRERARRLMGAMEPLPQPAHKSITFDRGIEVHELAQAQAWDRDSGMVL